MQVDLNGLDPTTLSSVTSTQQGKTAPTPVSDADADQTVGEDTATLSVGTDTKALAAKALESPETRQDKIEALRQAVQNGIYKIEPDKIAEAMIRDSQ